MRPKLCFVIMGFGKKTDPSGRTLDLDKTYKNIIKPAVEASGYRCIRADEILESGVIDVSMYALLIQAELVIADISTYNPNAIYELGIRHAVKPFSTIVIKEDQGAIPFDIDHTRVFKYAHLGDDIGTDESIRCQAALIDLIQNISKNQAIDSPLYEYLRDVSPPILSKDQYDYIIENLATKEDKIFAIVETALVQMERNDFAGAYQNWTRASKAAPTEAYFIQQRALCRYKSEDPTKNVALHDALGIIAELDTDGDTNDPETLGIAGSIYKRLWLLEKQHEYLKRAINYYGKGYRIRNDYYNGENLAHCLNLMAQIEEDEDEQIFLKISARKTRESIIVTLLSNLEEDNFDQRFDKKWVYATLSQCYFALKSMKESELFMEQFLANSPLEWEIKTFSETREELAKIIT